jgi:hypothetical protein
VLVGVLVPAVVVFQFGLRYLLTMKLVVSAPPSISPAGKPPVML